MCNLWWITAYHTDRSVRKIGQKYIVFYRTYLHIFGHSLNFSYFSSYRWTHTSIDHTQYNPEFHDNNGPTESVWTSELMEKMLRTSHMLPFNTLSWHNTRNILPEDSNRTYALLCTSSRNSFSKSLL